MNLTQGVANSSRDAGTKAHGWRRLALVRKPVRRCEGQAAAVVREGSTGQTITPVPGPVAGHVAGRGIALLPRVMAVAEAEEPLPVASAVHAEPELAFYRKYTEGMLQRYAKMSRASGRVPSLLGRELFRGNVTHYKVHGFDDVVIFCHDMEGQMKQLSELDQRLIRRIGVQLFTQDEVAGMFGMSLRSVVRRYADALDRLTRLLLRAGLLEPQKCCQ